MRKAAGANEKKHIHKIKAQVKKHVYTLQKKIRKKTCLHFTKKNHRVLHCNAKGRAVQKTLAKKKEALQGMGGMHLGSGTDPLKADTVHPHATNALRRSGTLTSAAVADRAPPAVSGRPVLGAPFPRVSWWTGPPRRCPLPFVFSVQNGSALRPCSRCLLHCAPLGLAPPPPHSMPTVLREAPTFCRVISEGGGTLSPAMCAV